MKVGENHESAKQSSEYLESLTQQAVALQKVINHIYSDTPSACIPPPKVCTVCQVHFHNNQYKLCDTSSHLRFSPVFQSEPSGNPSAAQHDMWNRSHSPQVNIKTPTPSHGNINNDWCGFCNGDLACWLLW